MLEAIPCLLQLTGLKWLGHSSISHQGKFSWALVVSGMGSQNWMLQIADQGSWLIVKWSTWTLILRIWWINETVMSTVTLGLPVSLSQPKWVIRSNDIAPHGTCEREWKETIWVWWNVLVFSAFTHFSFHDCQLNFLCPSQHSSMEPAGEPVLSQFPQDKSSRLRFSFVFLMTSSELPLHARLSSISALKLNFEGDCFGRSTGE